MSDWYKRDPKAFRDGTMGLTFEQKGAYSIVIDLIYEDGGPIPDNDRWISGVMGLSTRKWRSLKNDLVEVGKILIENGRISNVRAAFELENRAKLSRTRAEVGAKGGRTKREPPDKPLKNNNPAQAIAKQPDLLEESRGDKKETPHSPPEGNRGCRIPEDWQPKPETRAWAKTDFALTDREIEELVVEFRDYWLAEAGQRARKADWGRTFNNRIRAVAARRRKPAGQAQGGNHREYPEPRRKSA